MPNKPKDSNDDVPGTSSTTAPSGGAGAQADSEADTEETAGNMMLGREPSPPAQDSEKLAEQSGEGETQQTKSTSQTTLQMVFNQAIASFKKINDQFAQEYSSVLETHTGSAQVSENLVLKVDKRSGGEKKKFRCKLLFEAIKRAAPTDPVPAPAVAPVLAAVVLPPLPPGIAPAVATTEPDLAEELPDTNPPQPPPVHERPARAEHRDRDERPEPAPAPSARWAQFNLALTGLCAMLLVAVLAAVLTRSPSVPGTPTAAEFAKLTKDRDDARLQRDEAVDIATKANGLLNTEKALNKQLREQIAAREVPVKIPVSLADDIAAKVKVPPPKVDVTALNTALDNLTKKIDEKLKLPGGGATPTDVSNALTAVKTDVNNALAAFKTELSNVTKKQGATPTDVVVVVAHGRAMNANDYRPALSGALANPPHGRDKDALAKVGLAVAVTAQLNVLVAPDAPQAKVDDFGAPNPQASEEPARLGEQFAEKKELKSGRQTRAVLVVSAGCTPLGPNAAGWKDFKEVHVVLVAREKGDAEKAELVKWHEFAAARSGTVSVVGHGDAATQNRVLGERLKLLSYPLN